MADAAAPTPPNPDDFYTPEMRKMQEDLQTTNLANAVVHAIVRDELLPEMAGFISTQDYFFLSTVNSDGEPSVSYKGGNVGFAHVVNPKKIVFPSYNGNGMYFSAGNVTAASKVGLLFVDMCTPMRVRIQGSAKLTQTEEYMNMYPGAEFMYEVDIDKTFYNCARYIHKHQRVEEKSRYVPDDKGEAPFPAWKRIDMLQPFLHPDDMGKADAAGGTITEEEYSRKVMEGNS